MAKATVYCNLKIDDKLNEIISRQLNVKKVEIKKTDKEIRVELDTRMTEELEAEGFARELTRKIQEERKKSGLNKHDEIELFLISDGNTLKMIEKQKHFIKERTNSRKLEFVDKIQKNMSNIKIKNSEINLYLKKL